MKPSKMGSTVSKEPRGKFSPKSILSLICALALLSFLVLFISNHIVALIHSLTTVPQNLPQSKSFFVYIPFPVFAFSLEQNELYYYFLFIVACILISIIWMVKNDLKNAIKILLGAIKLEGPPLFSSKNSIILVSQLLLAYYFFYVIYWGSLDLLDKVQLIGSDYQIYAMEMFKYANAPVYEEIHFRVLGIGIPLLILSALLYPLLGKKLEKRDLQLFRYFFGGGFKLGAFPILLLILSSLIFAAAHVITMNIYTFPPMLLFSLMLGYLYLEKGVYACIVLHFAVTYMDMLAFANNSGYVSGITHLFLDLSIIAKYLLIAFGIVAGPFYFFYYGRSSLYYLIDNLRKFGITSAK